MARTDKNPFRQGSSEQPTRASTESFEHIPAPGQRGGSGSGAPTPGTATPATNDSNKKARLIYAKSHVAIHPTQLKRDNISGMLGLVEVDRDVPRNPGDTSDHGARARSATAKEILVVWVPDELFMRMSSEDQQSYLLVEGRPTGTPTEEDGYVFVSVPAPRGEKYAFSIPVTNIYSILVYPPSLSHWYGSATFNLQGGVSLPTLFFHDDQTPLVTTPRSSDPPTPPWGFPPFLNVLRQHATLLRSRLITASNNRGGELWLINPSRADREVHEAGYEEPRRSGTEEEQQQNYPPHLQYPSLVAAVGTASPRESLLVGLSSITNIARHTAQNVLNHPLAKPVVPHLPPAFRSLVNAPGEWENSSRLTPKLGSQRAPDVASEFESARLYLARWARVVAEEGEKSRRDELAAQAGRPGSESGTDETSLGIFSVIPHASRGPAPKTTRTPNHPITAADWAEFIEEGRDELFVRREIFRRGFTDSPEPEQQATRREGWEVLLGVVPWDVGGITTGPGARDHREAARETLLQDKRIEYVTLLSGWREKTNSGEAPEAWREEWHRIDVDCRRTDRQQPLYSVTPEVAQAGNEEKEGGGAGSDIWGEHDKEEEGGHASLNPHIAALRSVLMTYHVYSPELGYVQGMSDLLSPIYYVFDANEADAFWGLVGVMKMMESHFLRDQSGMRRQLSTLQQLVQLMDPELYAHLEQTEALNLFFVFRWILISFKREFKFENVIKLWEVLWTNYYSTNFVLFITLAVLHSHRDVILRYLTEFDEVLKYANDLSGTIDLDTTLAQAEVLFLSFRSIVEEIDQEAGEGGHSELRNRHGNESSEAGPSASSSTAVEARPARRTISPELRELLVSWQPTPAAVPEDNGPPSPASLL
ncbi:GTPase-activating protein GYP7 [Vanrija pseudolonga]|uniref:GTPase-activating protein GYP7 n=1 Tax=Vanrija pseudolonga TaxID=143232 RepID=A0AAF1BRB4_9TREE|nr:GTPase-activating protein GYP7 [Vanrija pseudolonga]